MKNKISTAIDNIYSAEILDLMQAVQRGQITAAGFTEILLNKPKEFRDKLALFMSTLKKTPEVTRTLDNRFKLHMERVKKRDIASENALFYYYKDKKNMAEGIPWLLKAAHNDTKNNAEHNKIRSQACFMLFEHFTTKIEGSYDFEKALYYLTEAFKWGARDLNTAIELAHNYSNGALKMIPNGVFELWLKWANEKKAQHDHKHKIFSALGWLYFLGHGGVSKDYALAKQYFVQGAEGNERDALIHLANFYLSDTENPLFNTLDIFNCCMTLAKQQFYGPLGVCYLEGIGIAKNPKLAYQFFQKDNNKEWPWTCVHELRCQLEEGIWPLQTKAVLEALETIAAGNDIPRVSYAETQLYMYYKKSQNTEKYLFWAKKSAERKNPNACLSLAEYYSEGKAKDEALYIHFLTLAAKEKNEKALCQIGIECLLKNEHRLGIAYLNEAIEYGSISAITELALCYVDGQGVSKNPKRAFELFSLATSKNDPKAMAFLGQYYELGLGNCVQDLKKAFEYYEKSYQLGNKDITIKLARHYLYGIGCIEDKAKAFALFSSLKNESILAQLYLGRCYEFGFSTEQNDDLAFKYYVMTSPKIREARFRQAEYWQMGGPVPKNVDKAISEYETLLLELQNPVPFSEIYGTSDEDDIAIKAACLFNLGICHLKQLHFDKALKYFENSQQLGHIYAQNLTAICYRWGVGTTIDLQKAELLSKTLQANSKIDPKVERDLWLDQKQKNETLFVHFLVFPNKFQDMLDLPNNSLFYLRAVLQGLKTKIAALPSPSASVKSSIDKAVAESATAFKVVEELSSNLKSKYEFLRQQITRICQTHVESIEKHVQHLQDDLDACKKQLDNIKLQNSLLTEIVEKLEAEQDINIRRNEAAQNFKNTESNQKKEDAATNQQAIAKSASELATETLKKQLDEKEYNEKRKLERENWKKITAEYHKDFLEKQKVEHDRKMSREIADEILYCYAQSQKDRQKLNFAPKPSARVLAEDWQVPLLVRFKEEKDLLETVTEFLKLSESNINLSLDDLWIEQELLINLLGRLMELSKNLAGKEIKIPVEAATGLRNVLLKHSYFEPIPEIATPDILERIRGINNTIKESVKKLSDFFKIAPQVDYSSKTWEEVSKVLAAPLLDDIVQKSKEPMFSIQKWTLDECIARVKKEESNLQRLTRYQGINKNEDCHNIVSRCCKARWGSTSSYVKANVRGLLGVNPDPTLYAYLVNEEYIKLGNEFRHSNQALIYSKMNSTGSAGSGGTAVSGSAGSGPSYDIKKKPSLLAENTTATAANVAGTGTAALNTAAADANNGQAAPEGKKNPKKKKRRK